MEPPVVLTDPPGEGKLNDDGGGKLGPPPDPPPRLLTEPGPLRREATAASLLECCDENEVDRLLYAYCPCAGEW